MKYFEYVSPLHIELKELGYGIPIEPSDEDKLLAKQILNSNYCDLSAFVPLLEEYHIRDAVKAAIRVYAYYINNPQQFNHDPKHIVGSAIRHMFNAVASFLQRFYSVDISDKYIKVRIGLIRKFRSQATSVWMHSAKDLAKRVEHNTNLPKEITDLNKHEYISVDLFR